MRSALVTGGSGFVAGHLVDLLLKEGYHVNATVRSLAPSAKTRHLDDLKTIYGDRLTLFEADLLRDRAFDAPMRGCDVVFHVASPFLMPEQIKDGRSQLLEPALKGTRNVLASVDRTESVRKFVLTSTVGAIFGDYADVLEMEDQTLTEQYFNTTSTLENNPYHYSKVEAEKEAWAICGRQTRWTMVSINPGLILGPALTPASDSGSLFLLDELLRGSFFYGAAKFSFTYADVRDVAYAHLLAARNDNATGRYIVAEKTMISFRDMSRIIRPHHKYPLLMPLHEVPNWAVRLVGPAFGLTQDYIRKHLDIRFKIDNRRSIDELGLVYRPAEETLVDHYKSWAIWREMSR